MTVPFIMDPVLGLRVIRKRTGRPAKLTGSGVSVARLTGASDLTVTVETPPSGATAYRVFANKRVVTVQAFAGRSVTIPLSRFYGEETPPSTVPVTDPFAGTNDGSTVTVSPAATETTAGVRAPWKPPWCPPAVSIT